MQFRNTRRLRPSTFFALTAVLIATASQSAPSRPPQAALPSLLDGLRRTHQLPALGGAIIEENGRITVGAVGLRKRGSDVPVTANDRFHLGSCTKAMTATVIAMLVEERKLAWRDTIGVAFRERLDEIHPAYRNVTLEQLLGHRGGFAPKEQSWPQGMTFQDVHALPGTPREQREAYVARALRQSPAASPGTYLYSNMGYTVAAVMTERAAKSSWEALMQRRLFGPLGMKSAGFGAMGRPGKTEQPWQHRIENGSLLAIAPGPLADNPPAIGPGGTVHSSLGDWAKFVGMHLIGERSEGNLLKPESFRRIHRPSPGGDYALGWIVTERDWGGGRVLTHAGSNRQNFAVVWIAPERGFAVLAATNQGGPEAERACDETASALIRLHQSSTRRQ